MAAEDGLRTLFPGRKTKVASTISYHFWFRKNTPDIELIIALLHNPMLEQCAILDSDRRIENLIPFPALPAQNDRKSESIDLEVGDDELLEISERGLLALNLQEMKAIQSHYRDPHVKRTREEMGLPIDAPTDAELECLAQTWSEHCSHKIFAAKDPSQGYRNRRINHNRFFIQDTYHETHSGYPERGRLATFDLS